MPKRNESHMLGRRNQIMDALLECIRRKGVVNTSVTDVAARSRLSIGAIYTHFASKDEILLAAARRSNALLESGRLFARFGDPRDFWPVIDRTLALHEETKAAAAPGADLELLLLARRNPRLRKEIELHNALWQEFFRGCVGALPGATDSARIEAVAGAVTALMMDARLRALAGSDIDAEGKRRAIRLLVEAAFPAAAPAKPRARPRRRAPAAT